MESVAVRVKDYDVLKALCDKKYRSPGAMDGQGGGPRGGGGGERA